MSLEPLNADYVNGAGVARLLLRAARNAHREAADRWEPDASEILGHDALDWHRLTGVLLDSGLARPLRPALDDPQLSRWSPPSFQQFLKRGAQREAVREAVGRDILERLAAALRALNTRGVLLKGAALAALAAASGSDGQHRVPRSSCDIDVWVDPDQAIALHTALLARGFSDSSDSATPRKAEKSAHHLPPVRFCGLNVEIHTRIMREGWGLPQCEMLERVRPISRFASHSESAGLLEGLYVLDDEAMLLHTLMHVTHHGFRYGLKAAWDVAWILDAHPHLDWERVAHWVRSCRMPLGFRVPAQVLAQELDLAIPPALWKEGGKDKSYRARQQSLHALASRNLLGSRADITPSNVKAMLVLLHETPWERAACLGRICKADLRNLRRTRTEDDPPGMWRFQTHRVLRTVRRLSTGGRWIETA